jgi:hypothetical protein
MWYRKPTKETMTPAPAADSKTKTDPLLPSDPHTAPPSPLQVTVAPSHPSHWITTLTIIQTVLAAEQPLLLQILPTKAKVGSVATSIGLDAVLAALSARFAA